MHYQDRLRSMLKINDLLGAILAIIGILAALIDQELLFQITETKERYEQDHINFILRCIQSGTTLILIGYFMSKYFKLLLVEIFICVLHNPPHLDWIFRADQMGKCCAKIGIEADTIFSLKCSYKDQPFLILGYSLLISSVVIGLVVRLFERPYYDDLEPISETDEIYQDYSFTQNGIWLTVITMTTVGFGDYYPRTHVGRFIIILSCFWGVFLVSMSIVSLNSVKKFKCNEQYAFNIMYRMKIKENVRIKAVNALAYAQKFWKLQKLLRNDTIQTEAFRKRLREQKLLFEVKLRDRILDFQRERYRLKIEELAENVKIKQLMEKIDKDLAKVSFMISQIREIDMNTNLLLQDQQQDIQKLKVIQKNIKILSIIMNRLDPESPGQKFISSKTFNSSKSITEIYQSDFSQEKRKKKLNLMKLQLENISKQSTLSGFDSSSIMNQQIFDNKQELQRQSRVENDQSSNKVKRISISQKQQLWKDKNRKINTIVEERVSETKEENLVYDSIEQKINRLKQKYDKKKHHQTQQYANLYKQETVGSYYIDTDEELKTQTPQKQGKIVIDQENIDFYRKNYKIDLNFKNQLEQQYDNPFRFINSLQISQKNLQQPPQNQDSDLEIKHLINNLKINDNLVYPQHQNFQPTLQQMSIETNAFQNDSQIPNQRINQEFNQQQQNIFLIDDQGGMSYSLNDSPNTNSKNTSRFKQNSKLSNQNIKNYSPNYNNFTESNKTQNEEIIESFKFMSNIRRRKK
eukprot:403372460